MSLTQYEAARMRLDPDARPYDESEKEGPGRI